MVTTWTHPDGKGLQDMIQSAGLHPVTLLYGIARSDIKVLLDRGIVTCARLKTAILNDQVNDLLDQKEKSQILENISRICKNNE